MDAQKKTILHADDVARWRHHVAGLLTPDFDVVSVEDCDAVLPRLEQGGIDLLILDHLMPSDTPDDTGFDIGVQVKQKYPGLPLILYTGAWQDVPVDRDELQQRVQAPVVFKEVRDERQDDLAARVRELLGNAPAGETT